MAGETGGGLGPLEIKFIHSSGPGGQNVNKVATAAQLHCRLETLNLTEPQLARLRALAAGQISRDGYLVITARRHRSQALNRAEVVARLERLLALAKAPPAAPRKATRPTRQAVQRRLGEKRQRARRKAERGRVEEREY